MKRKQANYSLGISVNSVRFSLQKSVYSKVLKVFNDSLALDGELGKGVMKYKGKYSSDKALFIGENAKLSYYCIVFLGQNGMPYLEKFRSNFLNLTKNKDDLQHIEVSGVEAIHVTRPKAPLNVDKDYSDVLEKTIKSQTKTVPKLVRDQNDLYIGGKTGSTSLKVSPVLSGDMSLQYIVGLFKIKNSSCQKFYSVLLQSVESSVTTLIGYFIVQQLARTNQTILLSTIQEAIIKEYNLGTVVVYAQAKFRSNTVSGRYVMRALSGVNNKLFKEDTGRETCDLLIAWWGNLEGLAAGTIEPPKKAKINKAALSSLLADFQSIVSKDPTVASADPKVKAAKPKAEASADPKVKAAKPKAEATVDPSVQDQIEKEQGGDT